MPAGTKLAALVRAIAIRAAQEQWLEGGNSGRALNPVVPCLPTELGCRQHNDHPDQRLLLQRMAGFAKRPNASMQATAKKTASIGSATSRSSRKGRR